MSILIINNSFSKNSNNIDCYVRAIENKGLPYIIKNTDDLSYYNADDISNFLDNNFIKSVTPFLSYKISNLELLYTLFDRNKIKYLNNFYNIKVSNDKEKVYKLAMLNNIDMPYSLISNKYFSAFNEIKDVSEYVVIKKTKGFGGYGVFRFNTYKEFMDSFDKYFIKDEKLIFQKYIQSDKNSTIRIILLNNKSLFGAHYFPAINDFRTNYGTIGKYHMTDEIIRISEFIAQKFSLGFVGLDFIKDKTSGKYLLLDVNPYPGIYRINKLYNINLASNIVDLLC